jgi:hypothetical protein
MPEAPVHKDDGAVSRQDDVRPSRKATVIQPEAKSLPVKCASDKYFRPRVATADVPHHPGARSGIDYVSHLSPWFGQTLGTW